jgi:hypothetical protein
VIGDTSRHSSFHFDASSYDDETDGFQDEEVTTSLNWTPWKTGIAFAHGDRILLVLKQKVKESCPEFLKPSSKLLDEEYRIEVHVYTNEWIQLVNELAEGGCLDIQLTPTKIIAYATRLLVMVSGHIKSLVTNWFPGMLVSPPGVSLSFVTFVPCWKCYAGISLDSRLTSKKSLPGHFICKDMNPVHCFMLEENIAGAALGQDLECPIHSAVKCVHMVPDLVSEFEYIGQCGGGIFRNNQSPPHPPPPTPVPLPSTSYASITYTAKV